VAKLEPVLDRRMLPCSFACRVVSGTHRALDTLHRHLRGGTWVLKVDVSKYFSAIDHAILRLILSERIACRRTPALVDQVLATYSAHDEYYSPLPGDDL
jgi:retron-type reverse transcriptase